jgi:hypothetical protein
VGTKYQSWLRGIVANKGLIHEIDEAPPKVMKGSKCLHTNGLYPHSISSRDSAALKVGYQQLLRAFHALGNHGNDGNKQVRSEHKKVIAILVSMLFF